MDSYDDRERALIVSERRRLQALPLAERRENEKDMAGDWLDAALVAERAEWLLNGDYGRGAQLQARDILAMSARANKTAQLGQLVAAVEWRVSHDGARRVWLALPAKAQKALTKALDRVLADAAVQS